MRNLAEIVKRTLRQMPEVQCVKSGPSRLLNDGVKSEALVNTVMNKEVKNFKYLKNV